MAMEMEEQDWGNERGREGRREGRKEGYLGTEAKEVINFCRICYPHNTRVEVDDREK